MGNRTWTIRDRTVSDESPCYIIAEVGHNHNGDLGIAIEMFRVAKTYGADAVKLQKRSRALYDGLRRAGHTEYAELRESREVGYEGYRELRAYAYALGLAFIVTPFDEESLDFVLRVGVDAIKVQSGDATNLALLQKIAQAHLPVILSTGGSSMLDVILALDALKGADVCILQCTSAYPCPPEHLNLKVIETYRDRFQNVVGLSSHRTDNRYEPIARYLGARVFEKHFTLDRNMGEGDHKNSLDPDGLRDLVSKLNGPMLQYDPDEYLMVLGDGEKHRLPCEKVGMMRLRDWRGAGGTNC